MEVELEPRHRPPYPLVHRHQCQGMDSPLTQRALPIVAHTDKSVLEWEIAVGLRYKDACFLNSFLTDRSFGNEHTVLPSNNLILREMKPKTFQKVRPRCEAPRRDMIYPTNYTSCRYVRMPCLCGNPIAIFYVQPTERMFQGFSKSESAFVPCK